MCTRQSATMRNPKEENRKSDRFGKFDGRALKSVSKSRLGLSTMIAKRSFARGTNRRKGKGRE